MQRKFFIRRMLICTLVMVLPVLFLGSAFYIYSSVNTRREIDLRSQNTAVLGKEYIDLFLNLASDQSALFDNSQSLSMTMYKILSAQHLSYEEYNYQRTFTTILNAMSNTREYVSSVYLYVDNDKHNFFRTGHGLQTTNNAADADWLSIYQDMPLYQRYWFVRRDVRQYQFESPRPTITFFNRLDQTKGVIVINFDPEKMRKRLDPLQMYRSELLFVTDEHGTILFENSMARESGFGSELDFNGWQRYSTGAGASQHVTLGERRYLMTEVHSDKFNVHFLSLVPEDEIYEPVRKTVMYVLYAVLVAFAISVLCSYYLTNKSFRQIHIILNSLRDAENGNVTFRPNLGASRDEYDTILNNMLNVFLKNNSLRFELAQSALRQRDAELTALQMQINPHFLFNTLQTIDLHLQMGASFHIARELLQDLADILKYAFTGTLNEVPLHEEIRYCKRYIHIQQSRYPNKFQMYWEYEEYMLDRTIMRLLFQPIIENSLYHGIKQREGPGLIRMRVADIAGGMHIRISDNGIGMTREEVRCLRENLAASPGKSEHIGLQNVNKRLLLSFGPRSSLHIWSKKHFGTVISFFVPCD